MTYKVTPKSMKGQYDHQHAVFCSKNNDYGNSFEKSLDTFGLVAGIVRIGDKFERLVSLNDPSKDALITSESLTDTLEDLSNYAAMAACWLKGIKAAVLKEMQMKELDVNIEDIAKKADTSIVKTKVEPEIFNHGRTSSIDTKTGKKFQPKFLGVKSNGLKELELSLNVDRDTFDKVMADVRRPSNLPKDPTVKVRYGDVGTFEFPDGIDTIASYLKQLSREEAKKENDRIMVDMILSRLEKGDVMRVVSNGDGSFTTYFENTDSPIEKVIDKPGEEIYFEREGWDTFEDFGDEDHDKE